jgi:hypothetical protein
MAARAPSLEILEHLVAQRRLSEAFAEARAILNAVNLWLGRVDAVAWKASPVAASEADGLAEFATRFCASFGSIVADPGFDPAPADLAAFHGAKRWLDTMFRVGAFGSSAHLLEPIGRSPRGEAWCFEGSAPQRFLAAWAPESGLAIEPAEWLAAQAPFAVPAFLAQVGARACLTEAAAAFRERLLDELSGDALDGRISPAALNWIVEPYLHCSYAAGPRKHAVKAGLMREMRRHCLAAGCVEAPPRGPRGGRPTILVTAEYFSAGHSVHRTHSRAIRGLRGAFHTIGLLNPDQRGANVDDCFDEVVEAPGGGLLDGAREASRLIVARAPDIVFHAGVGLSARVVALASLRLAPIQCASHGHTATTMSPAIDYFVLPGDYVDAPGAFGEKILGLPARAFPYEARAETPTAAPRRADGAIHVAVPASLPKLNPALLAALADIERRASRPVVFEFFPLGAAGLAHLDLVKTLAAALPSSIAHAEMDHQRYLDALAACDFFAGPFPYGNMNSIIDAMAAGLPGVCVDGSEPHARADAAIFARLGLPAEWVARDVEGYVEAALALIDSPDALARARELVRGVDWRERFCEGDESLLAKALLALLPARIDPAAANT